MNRVERSDEAPSSPETPDSMVGGYSSERVLQRAEELAELGDHKAAVDLLDAAKRTLGPNARVETARGWSLENLGPEHLDDSRAAYEEALKLDPDILEAMEGLANVLFASGELDAADLLYQEVVSRVDAIEDAELNALELQGWCLYKLSLFDRAVTVFAGALARDSSMVAVRFDLGLALLAKGEVGKAVAEYGKGIAQLRRVPPRRRAGALRVALDDLEAGINDRATIRSNYAAKEIRAHLAWELTEAGAPVPPELVTDTRSRT